ncbi:MAG: hypothetical protein ABTQ73_04715 [Caldilineales bacterium]
MRLALKPSWVWILLAVCVLAVSVVVVQWVQGDTLLAATAEPHTVAASAPAAEAVLDSTTQQHTLAAVRALAENSTGDELPAADVPSSDNCIACHTNQTLLQELAVEPEKVESELAAGEG